MRTQKNLVLKIVAIAMATIILLTSILFMAGVFHKHKFTESVIKPTCQQEGYTVHLCEGCGESYVDTRVEKIPHDIIELEQTEPHCLTSGLSAGKKCKNCPFILTAQKEIPSLNAKHVIVDGVCVNCGTSELARFIAGAKVLNKEEEYKYYDEPICKITKARSNIVYENITKDIIIPKGIYNEYERTYYTIISLADGLFSSYRRTQNITIQDNVLIIGKRAFRGCVSLERIAVDQGNPNYCDINFVLYNKEQNTIIACPAKKERVVISKSVTTILESAFGDCYDLTSIFYGGTVEDKQGILIEKDNVNLENATWYYYSESTPTKAGNFWRYVDGVPTAW